MSRSRGASALIGAIAALVLFVSQASASLTFVLGTGFSGPGVPSEDPPWLIAIFEDNTDDNTLSSGTVRLTMSAPNLLPSEKVGEWYFNVVSTISSDDLTFSASASDPGEVTVTSIVTPATASGLALKADGDGVYDFKFVFDQNAPDSFAGGDTLIYEITGTGLTAASFDATSSPHGGWSMPLRTAAHIQSLDGDNNDESLWIREGDGGGGGGGDPQIPEPVSLVVWTVLGTAVLGFMHFRRRCA